MSAGYVWWPSYRDDVSDLGNARAAPAHLLAVGVLTTILCLPAVVRATGIAATHVMMLIGAHVAWHLVSVYVIAPAPASRWRSHILMAGNLIVNAGVAVAIPLATGDPRTPLWMLPVVYACANGAMQEREPCITFLLVHVLSPLLALVVLTDSLGTDWGIAAPIVCAALCGVGYDRLATMSVRWRQLRAEQETQLADLRTRLAARDRQRLMRDLSESVGSTLAVVAMYADLIDEHITHRDQLAGLAAMVREAARDGLGELRGMLGAMAPAASDTAGLADTLRQAGRRATEGTAIEIVVSVEDAGGRALGGATRVTFVRAFQDALRAARQGDARRVGVRLVASGASISLEVTADSVGGASETARDALMAERVAELGGTFKRTPSGAGTNVHISLPRA